MPEFLYDVKTLSRVAHESFTSSSDYFATMWERIEAQSRRVGGP
jgi:hypothetical protein